MTFKRWPEPIGIRHEVVDGDGGVVSPLERNPGDCPALADRDVVLRHTSIVVGRRAPSIEFRRIELSRVSATLDVVDVQSLDEAIRLGIAEPAGYSVEPALTARQFLAGVDATPAHIGAGFDVLRPRQLLEIARGLDNHRYVLLSGPSGSGKSTLLWRAARQPSGGGRVVRILRLVEQDIESLLRFVRLQRPSETSPLVVACDDLGRPHAAGWPAAVRRLLEIPHIEVLGAARAEDTVPALMRAGGVLIELSLDPEDSYAFAGQLQDAGFELAMEIAEAVESADGHLMELIALLTTGRRLRAILADQVAALRDPGRPLDLEVARLVCGAGLVGVAIPATRLGEFVQEQNGDLGAALSRLSGEHVLLQEGAAWKGLHQLRSTEIVGLIHQLPPPTLEQSLADVVRLVDDSSLGWSVRRVAHRTCQLGKTVQRRTATRWRKRLQRS